MAHLGPATIIFIQIFIYFVTTLHSNILHLSVENSLIPERKFVIEDYLLPISVQQDSDTFEKMENVVQHDVDSLERREQIYKTWKNLLYKNRRSYILDHFSRFH